MRQPLLRRLAYKTSTFIVLTLIVLSGLSFNLAVGQADNLNISTPTNCDSNAVIYCGASSVNQLIDKYSNGDSVNSASSIQHIYKYFNITDSDIRGMNGASTSETVEVGSVNKNGDVLNSKDKVIARNALTAGRDNIAGSVKESYGGTVFYERTPSISFASDKLSAYVVMINNKFAYAILASCGNPVIATPVPTPTPTPRPKPTPAPKPTLKPTTTTSNYCSGNTVNVNSGIASQGGNCSQNTTIVQTPPPSQPTPFGQCTSLSLSVLNNSPLEISAVANSSTANGAALGSVVFNFGDGTITLPSSQMTQTHTYSAPGDYTITATLSFTATNQTVANASCQAELTSTSPPPTPTVITASAPTVSPPTHTTASLVNTGPGDVIAVFAGSTLVGMLGYRMFLNRRF